MRYSLGSDGVWWSPLTYLFNFICLNPFFILFLSYKHFACEFLETVIMDNNLLLNGLVED